MPRYPISKANRLITRIDTSPRKGTKPVQGWEVRIYRGGVRFNKFLSDSAHGSKTKALKAARALRDKMDLEIKPFSRRQQLTQLTNRNTSGHRGVRLRTTCITKRRKKYSYQHVEASWTSDDGTINKLLFSVAKLGLEKAWKQALACRKKGLAKIA